MESICKSTQRKDGVDRVLSADLFRVLGLLSTFYCVVTLAMTTKPLQVRDLRGDGVKPRLSGHGYNSAHRYNHSYHPKSRPRSKGSVVDKKQSAVNLSISHSGGHSPRSRTYVSI